MAITNPFRPKANVPFSWVKDVCLTARDCMQTPDYATPFQACADGSNKCF